MMSQEATNMTDELLDESLDNHLLRSTKPPTLCVKCSCHRVRPNNQEPRCGNPRFATAKAQIDFVTGRVINETQPLCRDINKGQCPGYIPIDNSNNGILTAAIIIIVVAIAIGLLGG